MNRQSWLDALCYEVGLWAAGQWPSLAGKPWFKMLMAYCRPDWAEWKTKVVIEAVDKQAAVLVKQWEKEERETKASQLADKARELFPESTITPLSGAIVPSVMIVREAPADASDDIKALGAELRITWQLPDKMEGEQSGQWKC